MARLKTPRGRGKGKEKAAPVEVRLEQLISTDFGRIAPGEHLCGFYRDTDEKFSIIIPFFRAGLQNNEKCIYILDESSKDEVIQAFGRAGLDLRGHLKSGQFELLSSEETYLQNGCFDPDRMVETLRKAEAQATEEGYRGLRVSGEMTWALKKQPGSEKLVEYEAKLNYFFPGSKTSAICLYNEEKFAPDILLDIIYTHPKIIMHGAIYPNHIYIPPDDFLQMRKGKITKKLLEKVKNIIIQRTEQERQRELAEEKLRASEQRYRMLVETMNEGLCVIDKDDRIIYVNNKYCEMLGYSREELLGRNLYEIVDSSKHEILRENLAKERRGEKVVYESIYVRKDGGKVFARVSAAPIFDANGSYSGAFAVISDITELRQALDNLSKSEREYRSLADNISDILLRIDLEGNCTYLSRSALEETGYSIEESRKMNIKDILTPESYEAALARIKMWKSGAKQLPPYIVRVRTKDGKIVPYELKTAPIFENGKLSGFEIVARNVTERMEAMQALEQARAYAEAIVETVHEPLVVLDADMKVISANPAFYECFKVSPEETEKRSLYELGNRQWDIPELRRLLKNVVEKNISFKDYVVVHDFPHIGRRIMMLNARQMRTKADSRPMVLLAIEDITERQQMESQLKRSNDIQTALVSVLSLPLSYPLEEILSRALKTILSLEWLGLQRMGGVFLADDEQNNLTLVAQVALPEALQKTCAQIPFGKCLCGRAAATKKILFTDHLDENHEIKYDKIKPHGHYCVPILLDEKVAGVLNLYVEEGHRQEEMETEFLSAVANALALIIARKNFEKQQLDLIYRTNEITHGECYLHRSHRTAFNIVSQLMLLGVPGICFTREAPEKLMEYGIPKEKIVVISSIPVKGFETTDNLQDISMRIAEFLKNNRKSIVLLDGLEYLMSRFGFDIIYKFLQEKRFQFIESDSVFILPVDLAVFEERERALLASELKIVG